MLDDVDIYAPFRGDNDGAGDEPKKPAKRKKSSSSDFTLQVAILLQTVFGMSYEIRLRCEPSDDNPKIPDADDFCRKFRLFAKKFNVDREAIKMYNSAKGRVSLKDALGIANNIRHLLDTAKPAHFLELLRRGGGEVK